jgi:hypothetical protein
LVRDDVANGFEALFILARRLLDVLGEHPQHRSLELDERLRHVESCGSPVLWPYGGRLNFGLRQPWCLTPFWFFLPASQPLRQNARGSE